MEELVLEKERHYREIYYIKLMQKVNEEHKHDFNKLQEEALFCFF